MSNKTLLCISLLVPLLCACQNPQRGSEEYWFNKMRDEQRAQCRLLPSPLSESCLKDVASKKYEDFQRQRTNLTDQSAAEG
ncbi:MAG: hypothetical protein E6Q75_13010 [Rheinheimera sp.]|nr:MAG: hypothetical protein E6Q75_13010 [Rheinheimera sp.]